MLWGNFARGKKVLIDTSKHLVLEAPHPSPFSVHSGFFGCGHFAKANEYLKKQGIEPIDWRVDVQVQSEAKEDMAADEMF